jgi:N-acetylmuramate 1-kinase
MNLAEPLIQNVETRLVEHHSAHGPFQWEPILHGGSDRDFYRVKNTTGSWIIMRYSDAKEENTLYADIGVFLKSIQLRVPQVLFHDPTLRLIGLQDLGEISLYSVVQEQGDVETLYVDALNQIRKLHQHSSGPRTMPGFDEKLYSWERNYFLENLVGRWAEYALPEAVRSAIEREGDQIGRGLSDQPRCFIHRDFQSQNLIVKDQQVWMIDFQGMRLGHAAYDVASLLFDPYVRLTSKQRQAFLKSYTKELAANGAAFEIQFYQAAAQRLMQALGAYGFLGLVKGKTHFLQYIPRGLENLGEALKHLTGVDQTLGLVQHLQNLAEERFPKTSQSEWNAKALTPAS